jgi:[protein-PII] uridylyltransferase
MPPRRYRGGHMALASVTVAPPPALPGTLTEALAALARPDGAIPRDAALAAFRRHLARIQTEVQDAVEGEHISGLSAARRLAALTDGLIAALHDHTAAQLGTDAKDRLCVAATGGYGRGVLAPFSDIDLLLLTAEPPGEATRRAVEFMLYLLWDLGLKVGHATRSVADCLTEAAGDHTIRTSLLDARPLAGDTALFADFHTRFRAACAAEGAAGYIADKQAERAARHRRYGESPYVVEPHIKEGRGGLRDLQTLYWLARYVFGTQVMAELADPTGPAGELILPHEAAGIRRAWDFLWTVRFHLHYVAGRAEERLTFDLQPVVGARLGYTRHGRQEGVERFMRHYFLVARDVARFTRVLEPAIVRAALGPPALARTADAALTEAGFVIADNQLLSAEGREFHRQPVQMLRILQASRDRGLDLHPLAVRALIRHQRRAIGLRNDPVANECFLDLLCGTQAAPRHDGARWLGILNETGILGRFIPDWSRIVGQMQFDTYHVFTVDEHTIEAVKVLNALEAGTLVQVAPIASSLIPQVQSRRALYTAMLLHDIAKGRGGDHSEIGAEIAATLCPRLGLSAEETETVSWLVLHHLLLSQTAFKRDIDDPKTILDLADIIQSPERLRLLLILTVADMRAVSPRVWNGWKATLLREVYARVAEVLAGGLATAERDARVQRAKDAVAELLADWTDADRAWFLGLGYPGYWLGFDPATHVRHAQLVREARDTSAPLTVRTEVISARAVTEVTVHAADHAGLFSRIAGALAVAGASIVDARIHTLSDGMALDTFWIQDAGGGAFDQPHRLARVAALIEQALSGRLRLEAEIQKVARHQPARMRAIHVPPRVLIDNHASNTHTVVEVNGRDRPGLLHDVTAAISAQGLQIASAHVTTYGVRAVDVFYVKDVFGLKIENERRLTQLKDALLQALEPAVETAAA